jgi:predicted adenine nucleotide alpha hydrolase (AANH) superfamily ATPase
MLNEIGKKIEQETGVKYLPTDFKKRGGYLRSIELSSLYNLYRQNYCGCEFSKKRETNE